MNVLLVHPKVPLSALSFPRIGSIMGAKSPTAPLGLITVAALLPDSWETRLVDLNCTDLSEADWHWADVVFLSGMFLQSSGLLSLVRQAKTRNKFVVCGGPYVWSVPEPALEAGADLLVRGEAEEVHEEILRAILTRRSGTVIQATVRPDMSTSPVPRFDLLDLSQYASMAVQTSRGCHFDCEFCDIVNLYGRKIRYKEPQQVINELETLYCLGWRGWVFVTDDNFTGNRTRASQILREMIAWNKARREPLSFWTQASLNLASDPELIDLMVAANFSYVLVGVESPDRSVLELSGKTHNLKNPIVESLRTLVERGITVVGSFIIGFDGEEKGVHERICALMEAAGVPLAFIWVLQAPPNTRLWRRLQAEGRLLPENTSGDALKWGMNFVPSRPATEILQEWGDTWAALYEPVRCLERVSRGLLSMVPAPSAFGPAAEKCGFVEGDSTKGPSARAKENVRWILRLEHFLGLPSDGTSPFRKHFRLIRKHNSSRLARYVGNCAFAADMFLVRDKVQQSIAAARRAMD